MADTNDAAILDRLSGDFKRVAEIVGVENALKLSREFGGECLSIPKLGRLRRAVRNTAIRAEYDRVRDKTGVVRRLARRHDLTTAQIYNILGEQPEGDDPPALPLFFDKPESR